MESIVKHDNGILELQFNMGTSFEDIIDAMFWEDLRIDQVGDIFYIMDDNKGLAYEIPYHYMLRGYNYFELACYDGLTLFPSNEDYDNLLASALEMEEY